MDSLGSGDRKKPKAVKSGTRLSRAFALAQKLLPFFAVGMFLVAIYFVHHLLKAHSYREILTSIRSIPAGHVGLAIVLTYVSYFVLSGYDYLGFQYIKRPVRRLRIVFAAMTAFAFSNNIGLANLAGGSIRLRIYSTYGVDPKDTLKVIGFVSVTFWSGFCALAGILLTLFPLPFPPSFGVSVGIVRAFGIFLILLAAGYASACALYRKPIDIRGYHFELPSLSLALRQIAIASADWALAGFVLYSLLPPSSEISFPQFLTIFVSAQVVALLAHVPGGVGVLEALVIYFVSPDHSPSPEIIGGLLAYRAIYYFLPLITAAAGLVSYEVYRKRHVVAGLSQSALSWTSLIIPPVASVIAFFAGGILLVSNATPTLRERILGLGEWLPLPLIETSHFLSSCVGALLLILSRGLLSRSNAAWLVTIVLISLSALLSLGKGLEYEDAAILLFFALILFGARDQFHRRAPLFKEPWGLAWAAAVTMVIGGTLWLGIFSHKHIEYMNQMWWTFALRGDAPRFLRATVGVLVTFTGVAAYHLLIPSRKPNDQEPLSDDELKRILESSSDPTAAESASDDTKVFSSRAHDALLRYRIVGQVWIALGDPIGLPDAFEDLVYDFIAAALDARATAIFDRVHSDHLPLFSDLKMSFIPIGEDIVLEINDPPEQSHVSSGFSFELLEPAGTGPIAVLSQNGIDIAAANLLAAPKSKDELAIGALELSPSAPPRALENLLLRLMRWAHRGGYHALNLGTFTVGQLDNFGSAPEPPTAWAESTHLLYAAREKAYNLRSLSVFLEKFAPRAKRRYLAYPSRTALEPIFDALVSISRETGTEAL